MENIATSDFVLFVCTPIYKQKADGRKGGVGYESNIITGSIFEEYDERKFIPILFSGEWSSSLPIWARGKKGVDFREGDEESLYGLFKQLHRFKDINFSEVLGEEERTREWNADYRTMTIIDEDGEEDVVDVVVAFEFKDTKDEYIVYTKGERDYLKNITVYVSRVDRSGGDPRLLGIDDVDEWNRIKEVLIELSSDVEDEGSTEDTSLSKRVEEYAEDVFGRIESGKYSDYGEIYHDLFGLKIIGEGTEYGDIASRLLEEHFVLSYK